MTSAAIPRPSIPLEFYRPSVLGTTAFTLYALLLFLIPSVCIDRVMVTVGSLPLRIALMVPLTILSGFGAHLLGWLGHDGTHLSLHKNKYISVTLGLFFSSMLVTYFEMGFAFEHWNHHRYCNQPLDPDIKVLSRLKTWWQRLLLTRIVYNLNYARILFRVILGLPLGFKYKLPFKQTALRAFCWLNLAFSLFWLSIYAVLAMHDWRIFVFCIFMPTLVGLVASGPQSYIDHAGVNDKTWENSRTRTSRLATVIWFGGNYHLEHHLYPGVPNYRLPKVHKYLKQLGVFERVGAQVDTTLFGAYRHLSAPYAVSNLEDSSFDPNHPSLQGTY